MPYEYNEETAAMKRDVNELQRKVAVIEQALDSKTPLSDHYLMQTQIAEMRGEFKGLRGEFKSGIDSIRASLESFSEKMDDRLKRESSRTDSIFAMHEELMNKTAKQREDEHSARMKSLQDESRAREAALEARTPISLIRNVFVPIGGFLAVVFTVLGSLLYFFWPLIERWQTGGG